MRRLDESPPEVRALVADRLQYVLEAAGPRRSRARSLEQDEDVELPVDALDADPERPLARSFVRVHLAVVTILVLVGLCGAGWALLRARPVAIATPDVVVAASTSRPGVEASGSASASTSARPGIVVHVIGAVHRPGLVRLSEGARVQDALDAAGGLTGAARPGRLNLAQLLTDGQQVVIGTARDQASEVRDGTGPAASSAGPSAAATIDLNRATAAELEQLPGVGPVTAAAILAWRTEHGRFTAISELQQVDGIGPKTYAQIAPHVRV